MSVLVIKLGAAGDVVRTTVLLHLFDDVTWITDAENLELVRLAGVRALSWEQRFDAMDRAYELIINLEDCQEAAAFATSPQTSRYFGSIISKGGPSYTRSSAEWFDMSLISHYGREKADRLKLQNRRTYQEILFSGLGRTFHGQQYCLPKGVQTDLKGDVAICPKAGKGWPSKDWAFYQDLERQLAAEGLTINVLPKRDSLLTHLGDVRNHRCLISGDSLPMHLALGSGISCITIFTCTSPWEIYAYGLQTKIVSPVLESHFYQKAYDPSAARSVAPSRVFEAAMQIMTARSNSETCFA
jgi:heptosyltransferase II